MKRYIDLHMHSYYSDDGEYTPEQLVTRCHQRGIDIMAITDHNSVSAIDEELQFCKEMGILAIPAVEIDCVWNGIDFHVVGYGIDYHHEDFKALEDHITKQELVCSRKRVELTNQLGFSLTERDLEEFTLSDIWTGELFAELLLSKPEYQDHALLKPYREGGHRSDNPMVNFYWDFYAQGKPCYLEIHFPTFEETLDLIHRHGGVAVLAHPGINLKGQFDLFPKMAELGLDGVEAFSSYHTTEISSYFYNQAKLLDMMVTCGSDFHGKTKPSIQIGDSGCEINQHEIEAKLRQYGLIA